MKKIFLTFAFLCFTSLVFSQNLGGVLLKGSTPILKNEESKDNVPLEHNNSLDNYSAKSISTAGVPTGNSTEVGITEGQLSVSLTGAATYSIPIAVPPGINGIVPQVSLTYNSQGGNGTAGYGWNLSGISTITRIPSTKFHDGAIDPVDFDNLDRFALDGQRLVVKNGTTGVYGADATVYETESFSNIKITSVGSHTGPQFGPNSFKVEYPDGTFALYQTSSPTEWVISYWENPQGVRITYNYQLVLNTLRISSITYGTLNTSTGINEISFVYDEARQRSEQSYVGGQSIKIGYILRTIRVKGNGEGYRNYHLEHNVTTSGYQRLEKIYEKVGDDSLALNPTVFSYDNTNQQISYSSTTTTLQGISGVNSSNSANISGDFNGDGSLDFLLYKTEGPTANKEVSIFTNINGTSSAMGFGNQNIGYFVKIFPTNFLTFTNKLSPFQGFTAVHLVNFVPGSPLSDHYDNVNFKNYYIYDGVYVQDEKNVVFPTIKRKFFYDGDFNGDGLTDVVAVEINQKPSTPLSWTKKTYFVDLDKSKTTNFMNYSGDLVDNVVISASGNPTDPEWLADAYKVTTGDVNGDGKTDLIHFTLGKVSVYSLNDSNILVEMFSYLDSNITGDINTEIKAIIGDYNGDGKTDFIMPNGTGSNTWYKYISSGVTFIKTTVTYNFFYSDIIPNQIQTWVTNDFDNDGKSDLLLLIANRNSNNTAGLVYARCRPNIGETFVQGSTTEYSANSGLWPEINQYALPIFYKSNQPNSKLEVAFIAGNKIHYFISQKDFGKEKLLRNITTGNGVVETITYKPLVQMDSNSYDNPNVYYKEGNYIENYPNADILIAPSLNVVYKLEKQSVTDYKKQFYTYYGAVANVSGLGFIGFRATLKTNWHNSTNYMISNVSRFDMNLRGALMDKFSAVNLWTVSNAPGSFGFITKSIYTYNTDSTGIVEPPLQSNKVYKLKNTKLENINKLENTSSITTNVFDIYNNITKSTNSLKEASTIVQTNVIDFTYYNQPTGTSYYIGRPKSKIQTNTIYPGSADQDITSASEYYTYFNHLLTRIKKKGNNTVFIHEENGYDNFGNIVLKRISDGNTSLAPLGKSSQNEQITNSNLLFNKIPSSDNTATSTPTVIVPRLTQYQYDPSGRYLIKVTDIEGLETNFSYNLNTGVLNNETNPYGLTTYYEYDKWFKKKKTTDYLGKNKFFNYQRDVEKTLLTITVDDGSSSTELFDDLGRKIKASEKNINNTWTNVSYLYDIYDRNYKVSEPYIGTSALLWNETKYDGYGRIYQIIDSSTKTTTFNYYLLTTTADDGVKSKVSVKNAMGNIVSLTDNPGGQIIYKYFANGNLKTTDYGGVVTSIEQDGWGRKTKLTDPSAGIFQYEYNFYGETIKETTPKGVTNYVIDNVGKIKEKTVVGDFTNTKSTYAYDAATKLLVSDTYEDLLAGSTTINSYEYDGSKRLWKAYEIGSQVSFQRTTEYDLFGRPDRQLYTAINASDGKRSDKWIKNTYQYGFPYQIKDDTTQQVLWQTNTVNARGQILTAALSVASGITITNEYDDYGFPTLIKHDKGTTNIINLASTFDPLRGNLKTRNNNLIGTWSEDFTNSYDAQDRLLNYKDATGTIVTQSYLDNGKIQANTLGNYDYTDSNHPYQLTSILPANTAIYNYYAGREQNVAYNVNKKPVSITEASSESVDFEYNSLGERAIMYYGDAEINKNDRIYRKFYSSDGSMEIKRNTDINSVEFITYIGGDAYTAPLVFMNNGNTLNEKYFYLHRDYQGSIMAISNTTGVVVEKRLYDAWGAIIKFSNSSGPTAVPTTEGAMILDRGYTGHEHLLGLGIINMNGRLYDPKFHRFLSPDNYVQDPFNTQNYNRYAYCYNNPFKYNDKNGEWVHIVVGAVIGGVVNWGMHGFRTDMEGLKAFGIGAGAGALGAATGGAAFGAMGGAAGGAGGFFAGAGSSMVGTMFSNAFLSIGNHLGFGDPLMSAKDFATSTLTAGVTGGLINGSIASANGRSFWSGTAPRPTVQPITIPNPAAMAKEEVTIKSDAKLPNPSKSEAVPTTQSNTTSKVTITKNLDGNGYKIDGLGIDESEVTRQLQAKFKHAADFGLEGNYNKENLNKFGQLIQDHMNSNEINIINGTYRGQPVTHYLNPNSGLNVITSPSGQFISGWKLNPDQLQNVLNHGGL